MSAIPEATSASVVPCVKRAYGVHECSDRHGNHGWEVLSQRHIKFRVVRTDGLFDPGMEKTRMGVADYFCPIGSPKRKVFVVVDSCLPKSRVAQIEDYFVWCKLQKLLEDYIIMPFAVNKTEKTFEQVTAVITAANKFGIRRRDLFIAVGGTMVVDTVGFAAAIYRRSVMYISVPTDLVGIIYCHTGGRKVSMNHMSNDGEIRRDIFALSHLPVASFYDLSFLDSLHKNEIVRGLVEIIRISVVTDEALFSYAETHLEQMLGGTPGTHLATAAQLAARAVLHKPCQATWGKHGQLYAVNFAGEAVRAIEQIKGITYDDANSVAIGIALTSALSFLENNLSSADLGRVLNVLEKIGLPICDETLKADALWEHMRGVIRERGDDSKIVVSAALGKGGCMNFTDISRADIGAAWNVLRKHCRKTSGRSTKSDTIISTMEIANICDESYELTISEDVQYHVFSAQNIFSSNNSTIIQNCRSDDADGRKKKILIVVDDYFSGNALTDISAYFKIHSSAIDECLILSMHVSSNCKDTDSALRVIDAAIGVGDVTARSFCRDRRRHTHRHCWVRRCHL